MKVVVQRASSANVKVNNEIVGEIDKGLVLLVSFTTGDGDKEIDYVANKVSNLRIFDDENEVPNLSVKDVGGSILSISQFTLYADTTKGNRPSYLKSLSHDEASVLYDKFNNKLVELGLKVETGIFREYMEVSLTNDGPFTIIIEK